MRRGIRPDGGPFIPLAEIEVKASRSSGPGGQHANVTASRIEVRFDVAGSASLNDSQRQRILDRMGPVVTAVAQDARSQARNRELALERLETKLSGALARRRKRRPTRPTRSSREKRLESKRRRSRTKRERRRPSTED